MIEWLAEADARSPWQELRVLVAGIGRSGIAATDALLERGASVTALDASTSTTVTEAATMLELLGAQVRLGPDAATVPDVDLVVTSPGWRPTAPLLADAARRGIPIWGDVELAWRLQHPDRQIAWLGITGTNGKTTTTQMLESMLLAAGLKAAAVGNIGRPVLEALADGTDYDAFAVELSSFQLHWSSSLALHSAVVLNVEPDHLEWYADSDSWQGWPARSPMEAYAFDKSRIYHRVTHSCVYNVEAPVTEKLVEEAEVTEGARAIGFTTGIPAISMVGVVDDLLVDRAFIPQRRDSAIELAKLSDVRPYAPHNVANALAAAALARSYGVPVQAVRDGLQKLVLGGHRIETVAVVDQVTYVDDSKATNPHAAEASLSAYDSVVWIAGGQAKNTTFDELVQRHRARLRGAVLLGVDRHLIADALARHAPEVPVIVVDSAQTDAMHQAVEAARSLAQPGDTVLLAPGCASKDMYSGYDARGDAFAHAVKALDGAP